MEAQYERRYPHLWIAVTAPHLALAPTRCCSRARRLSEAKTAHKNAPRTGVTLPRS
jgi:hypothetical protein